MTNKNRLIPLEKVKSALEAGRDELLFNTINKDHKGHEDRELTLRGPERMELHSALQLAHKPALLIVAGMALGETRRPGL